jgi:hypothetical protein
LRYHDSRLQTPEIPSEREVRLVNRKWLKKGREGKKQELRWIFTRLASL